MSQYNASKLEILREETKYMQENALINFGIKNKEIQQKEISEAYAKAK